MNELLEGRVSAVFEEIQEREAREKEREKDQKSQPKAVVPKGLARNFFQVTDKPFYISFLTPITHGIELFVHNVYYKAEKPGQDGFYRKHLCTKMFKVIDSSYDNCEFCEMRDDKGKKNKASGLKAYIVYVHNFEGDKFTPPNQTGDNIRSYDISPVRVAEFRAGKGGANLKVLTEEDRDGFLIPSTIYKHKKTGTGTDTVYHPIEKVEPKWLGKVQFKGEVPQEIVEKYQAKSKADCLREILMNYNLTPEQWAMFKLEPITVGAVNEDGSHPEKAEETTAPAKKTKKAIEG